MSNNNSDPEVPPGSPPPLRMADARFYIQNGRPRVEISDGYSSIDLPWRVYEELVARAGERFTTWALRDPAIYRAWLEAHDERRGIPRDPPRM